jgi:hypothetical protein
VLLEILEQLLFELQFAEIEIGGLGKVDQDVKSLLFVFLAYADVEGTVKEEDLLEVLQFHDYLAALY